MAEIAMTYSDVYVAIKSIVKRHKEGKIESVFGVPRGGGIPAALVSERLQVPLVTSPSETDDPKSVLVVDDIVDSGRTAESYIQSGYIFDALVRKPHSPAHVAAEALVYESDDWIIFPWEVGTSEEQGPTEAVVRLLEFLGEDPNRPGLVNTPKRVVNALKEMTSGYAMDPAEHLGTVFPDRCDEMIVVRDIEFTSLCEHHLLSFTGTVAIGYIPSGDVVGLSKLARVVDVFARRLQVQERLTEQIADALVQHLKPKGVGVIVEARHSCMGCRGVRKPSAKMLTSSLRGVLHDRQEARAEFLNLAR